MRNLKLLLLFCAAFILSISCATMGSKSIDKNGTSVKYNNVKIKPSGMYEECVEMKPGMSFEYRFDASSPVNFNIHYHTEDAIHYPVQKESVRMDKGMVDPNALSYYTKDQEYFCLMWDNINAEPVDVSYSCTTKHGAQGHR